MKLSLVAALLLLPFFAAAQEPAAVPLSAEPHHHLVFENAYVRAYYVDVPAHQSTLRHRHDLPYFAVLLSGGSAPAPAAASTPQPPADAPRAIFSPTAVSHTVPNPADTPFRNVTVELLHPQGAARNRCQEVLPNQPREQCDRPAAAKLPPVVHYAVFETSEILVEYWDLTANVTAPPRDDRFDMLLVDLDGPVVSAAGAASYIPAQGGVLWLPAGSRPVFRTPDDRGGHFFAITFKDSAAR
jgi:hypothetical protein